MEKDGLFIWQSDSHITAAAGAAAGEMNNDNHNSNKSNSNCIDESQSAGRSSMIMATSCFLNLNWDQSSNFESALSSLVSSPTSSNLNPNIPCSPAAADSTVIRELIGRLGSICNNNSEMPNSHCYNSTHTSSCYSTPLNSPPKLNPAMTPDMGFAERAARFGAALNISDAQFGNPGQLSRVSSSQSLTGAAMMMIRPPAGGSGAQQEPSVNAQKRKPSTAEVGNLTSKRCKSFAHEADGDAGMATTARTSKVVQGQKQGKDEDEDKDSNDAKPLEPPKLDYIHVRARRGQATDSHSLAERVRRERISERMKFLQDLVPGCNKVTGKAVMLDEIINYVQSLQRQVEFLSMKLATVNPRLEFNMDCLLSKDIHQPLGGPMLTLQASYPLEASCTSTGFSYETHLQRGHGHGPPLRSLMVGGHGRDNNTLDATSLHLPLLDGFIDNAASSHSQLGAFWEDDLQSVVQMGNHMKVEL